MTLEPGSGLHARPAAGPSASPRLRPGGARERRRRRRGASVHLLPDRLCDPPRLALAVLGRVLPRGLARELHARAGAPARSGWSRPARPAGPRPWSSACVPGRRDGQGHDERGRLGSRREARRRGGLRGVARHRRDPVGREAVAAGRRSTTAACRYRSGWARGRRSARSWPRPRRRTARHPRGPARDARQVPAGQASPPGDLPEHRSVGVVTRVRPPPATGRGRPPPGGARSSGTVV